MESFPFFVDRAEQYVLERSAALRATSREIELNAPDLGKATKHYLVKYTPEGDIELQPRGANDASAAGETLRETLTALSAFAQRRRTATVGALNERCAAAPRGVRHLLVGRSPAIAVTSNRALW